MGHGPHSSTLFVICVVRLLFVLFYVLFVCKCVLTPGDNPIAVNKYIIPYSCQVDINLDVSRQIFGTYSNITFHENPSSEGHDEVNSQFFTILRAHLSSSVHLCYILYTLFD
jgi:hypothetical protein